jgi:DNA-binding MarR family transcriptional regulator
MTVSCHMEHTQQMPLTHPPPGQALTAMMREVCRLHGLWLAAGERLTHPLGLSSARWQVLSALYLAGEPLPVAYIARHMGLTRQSVQRTVDILAAEGLVAFADNPHHRRAKLVRFTPQGSRTMDEVHRLQSVWANDLAHGLSVHAFHDAMQLLEAMRLRLEAQVRPRGLGRQALRRPPRADRDIGSIMGASDAG